MPIVFIHSGYSPYLEFSLRQARAANPDAEIVLLGDPENDRFPFLRHVDTTGPVYVEALREITRVYRHRSTNGREFELVCFQRWFLLRAFMEAHGVAAALVLDSDVLLYATEAEIRAAWLGGRTLGLCWPAEQGAYRWMASPHVSYWTAAQVAAFTAFVLGSYTEPALAAPYEEKWHYHLQQGHYGGVCDMTALHLFAEGQGPGAVVNFAAAAGGVAHDLNINEAENETVGEYRMAGPIKDVTWDEEGRPVGYNTRLGAPVRFQSLHFQGKAKEYMPQHYRGAPFDGREGVRRRLTGHYRVRRIASSVIQPARLLAGRLGLR